MKQKDCLLALLVLTLMSSIACGQINLVSNGPDGEKLVFAILGDGYTHQQQDQFRSDVDRIVLSGVFGHDFYKSNQKAFNLYRFDLESTDSGVSTPTFIRHTALSTIYTGTWATAWIDEGDGAEDAINAATSQLNKVDFVLVILNEPGYGGVRIGNRMFVTSGTTWQVAAHEYGHGVGGLFDEYTGSDVNAPISYGGPPLNARNVSTVLDRKKVAWGELIRDATTVPTTTQPTDDPNTTVGEFEGANYADHNIYRPVYNCRMRSIDMLFCPACFKAMTLAIRPYLQSGPSTTFADSGPPHLAAPPLSAATASSATSAPTTLPTTLPAAGPSYITMVIRVSKDGNHVISAKEVQGRLVHQPAPLSSFMYQVKSGINSLTVESLPNDPFIKRGAPDPKGTRGEARIEIPSATIVVNIPSTGVANAPMPKDLNITLIRAKTDISQENVSTELIQKLTKDGVLDQQTIFDAKDIAHAHELIQDSHREQLLNNKEGRT